MKNKLSLLIVAPVLLCGSVSTYAAPTLLAPGVINTITVIKPDSRLAQISNQLKSAQARWATQRTKTASLKYSSQYQFTVTSTVVDGVNTSVTEDLTGKEPVVTMMGSPLPYVNTPDPGICTRPVGTTSILAKDLGPVATVADAFKLIQAAIDKKVARLDVTFDEVMGYPTSIFIDPNLNATCDDAKVKIVGFERMTLAQLEAQRKAMSALATTNLSKWKAQKTKAGSLEYTARSVANMGAEKSGVVATTSEILTNPAKVTMNVTDPFVPNYIPDKNGNPIDISHVCDASLQAGANVATGVTNKDGIDKAVNVEAAFNLIQTALKNKVARLDVQYDPALGYPTSIYVDRSTTKVCDDVSFEVTTMSVKPKTTTTKTTANTLTVLK